MKEIAAKYWNVTRALTSLAPLQRLANKVGDVTTSRHLLLVNLDAIRHDAHACSNRRVFVHRTSETVINYYPCKVIIGISVIIVAILRLSFSF